MFRFRCAVWFSHRPQLLLRTSARSCGRRRKGRAGCGAIRCRGAGDGRHKAEDHSGNESARVGKRVHRSAGEFSNRRCAPDPNASVGATQIVETVNLQLAVFDKATGAPTLGPTFLGSLWSGFNASCSTAADIADPVGVYDKQAGRWLVNIHLPPKLGENGRGSGRAVRRFAAEHHATDPAAMPSRLTLSSLLTTSTLLPLPIFGTGSTLNSTPDITRKPLVGERIWRFYSPAWARSIAGGDDTAGLGSSVA